MIRPFGEAALLVEVDGAAAAQALDASLRAEPVAGVVGSVPGLSSVLVELDPLASDPASVERALRERVEPATPIPTSGRERRIPVAYGGRFGPDLPEVAALTKSSGAEIVARHSAAELTVLFDGFAPGFAYLGDLPDELRVPRLATPRTRTPAGSVGIAGAMSGIYPAELPGGWRIIGRTPLLLFDPRREPPAYLAPGDSVRFEPISVTEWPERPIAPDDW